MPKEIDPKDTTRAAAYEFWMKAPNPMVTLAVNTIVKNKEGEVSSCDLSYKAELDQFNKEYLKYTAQVAASCQDRDLSEDSMVIGTSAVIDTELDGAVGMNSGIFNNHFLIWGRYKKKWFRYYLPFLYITMKMYPCSGGTDTVSPGL